MINYHGVKVIKGDEIMSDQWLTWARKIQAIAQSGLAFSKDIYDIERYEQLKELSAEIIGEYSGQSTDEIVAVLSNESGYQTPKIDVRGVVFRKNKILLVRENVDNKWSLPGGFCDVGLSASENVIKEIQEESGFICVAKKLIALLDMNKHPHPKQIFHYYKIFILCEITGGQATCGIETEAIDFFPENNLPPLSLNRNTEEQIKMAFGYLKDPHEFPIID